MGWGLAASIRLTPHTEFRFTLRRPPAGRRRHDSLPAPGELVLATGRKYPHPVHVEETGMSCEDCHQGEEHPPVAPATEGSCKSCHKGEKALPDLEVRRPGNGK